MSEENRKSTGPAGGNPAGDGKAGQDTGSGQTGAAAHNGRAARRPHGPHGGMMPGEKAKDFKGTFRKLLSYMGRYKIALIAVMIFAAGSTVFNIIGPKVLAKATTELFEGMMAKFAGTGGIDFQRIGQILLLLLGLYALSALLGVTMNDILVAADLPELHICTMSGRPEPAAHPFDPRTWWALRNFKAA